MNFASLQEAKTLPAVNIEKDLGCEPLTEKQELNLDRAINLTLKDNFQLKAQREKVKQTAAQFDETKSLKGLKARIEGKSVIQGPEVKLKFPLFPEEIVLATKYNTAGAIVVENLLTTFGKVENQIAASFLKLKAEAENYEAHKSNIILETKQAYFNILKAGANITVAEDYVKLSESYRELACKHHDKGVVSRYDVLRAELSVEQAHKNLISAQKALDLSKSLLLTLMGVQQDLSFEVKAQPAMIPSGNLKLEELLDKALQNRYELKSMNANLQAAQAILRAANCLDNPDIMLTGSYGAQTMKITFMPQYNWSAGLAIRIPISSGGETQAKRQEAQALLKQIENAKLGLEQQIKLEVKKAWLDISEAFALVQVSLKEVEKNQEGYRLAQARYREGVSLAVEMDEALASYHNSRKNLVSSIYDLNLAVATLEKAIGTQAQLEPYPLPDFDRCNQDKGGN